MTDGCLFTLGVLLIDGWRVVTIRLLEERKGDTRRLLNDGVQVGLRVQLAACVTEKRNGTNNSPHLVFIIIFALSLFLLFLLLPFLCLLACPLFPEGFSQQTMHSTIPLFN